MSAGQTTAALPFLLATARVFRLALRGMTRTWRSLFLLIVLGLPVLIALVQRLAARSRDAGADLYGQLLSGYFLGCAVPFVGKALPLAALFYAAALISDEVEGRTLVYYLVRPIPRSAVVAGRFVAFLAWTAAAACASLCLVFLLARGPEGAGLVDRLPALARDLGVSLLALASYGGLFVLVGALLRRPLLPGLLFLYVWELFARLLGPLSRLTLSAYLEPLMTGKTLAQGLPWLTSVTTVSPTFALVALALVALLGVTAASVVFAQREYVPDQ